MAAAVCRTPSEDVSAPHSPLFLPPFGVHPFLAPVSPFPTRKPATQRKSPFLVKDSANLPPMPDVDDLTLESLIEEARKFKRTGQHHKVEGKLVRFDLDLSIDIPRPLPLVNSLRSIQGCNSEALLSPFPASGGMELERPSDLIDMRREQSSFHLQVPASVKAE